jgi:hypothetical protein
MEVNPIKESKDEKQERYEAFLKLHKDRVAMWRRDHGERARPPIIELDDGTLVWMNRSQMRSALKKIRSSKKK